MASLKSRLIIGRQPIIEAITNQTVIDKVLLQNSANGEAIAQIKSLCRQHQIPVQIVPAEKLNSFTGINHQGVIAIAALVDYVDLEDLLNDITEDSNPLFLMLDGVTDVRNIGAIARTAWCCGVDAIIIPDKGVGALNEEAIKSSAGALEKIKVCRVNSLMKAVDELHAKGVQVLASEMKANTTLTKVDFKMACCVIMGSEDKGVFKPLLKICDNTFSIPMANEFESLNVSVAAGIILFEAFKQRL